MRIALCLKALKGDEHVDRALLANGLVYLVAESYEGNDASAALCHTVNLGELNVVTCGKSGLAYNTAGEQCSLSADADNHNIHIKFTSIKPWLP